MPPRCRCCVDANMWNDGKEPQTADGELRGCDSQADIAASHPWIHMWGTAAFLYGDKCVKLHIYECIYSHTTHTHIVYNCVEYCQVNFHIAPH